jgi:hypothetical protein
MLEKITINGKELTSAQAQTVYVALQSFAMKLVYAKNPLGDDEHGKDMTVLYLKNYREINKIIFS